MQFVRLSVLKHMRLRCSMQLSRSIGGGRLFNGPTRYMCSSSNSTSSEHLNARVIELVKKFDKTDGSKVSEMADFQKDLSLDSLDRVELVMAIEQEFSIEIPDDKADKLTCCADVVKFIQSEAQPESSV